MPNAESSNTTAHREPDQELSREHGELLLEAALRAIQTQLSGDLSAGVEEDRFPAELRRARASFVTLRKQAALRGCIGSLESASPLVVSVWHNARQAAFHDPRFPPLQEEEINSIEIQVSILSPLERLDVTSEESLLGRLRPGVDGLLIADGSQRGTFLPAVWDSLPEPREFVRELKRKAGLAADHWSNSLEVWRYTAQSIPR